MAMPAPLDLDHVWTVEMLDALPDDGNRYEIVDGELLVCPLPSPPHQRTARELGALLQAYARSVGGIEAFGVPISARFSRTTEVQPDVSIVRLVDGKPARRARGGAGAEARHQSPHVLPLEVPIRRGQREGPHAAQGARAGEREAQADVRRAGVGEYGDQGRLEPKVMTPSAKRETVATLVGTHGLSVRHAYHRRA